MAVVVLSASRLEKLELEHEHGRLRAVDALRKIHDEGLYAEAGYATWEQYLDKRWGYSKTYGKYLLGFSRLREECKKQGVEFLPENEAQVRKLIQVAERKKIDPVNAWQIAVDTAPKKQDVPQVTAQHVESTKGNTVSNANAKSNKDTLASDFNAWLVRGRELVKRAKGDGHAFTEKYKSKPFPQGYEKVVTFLMECASADDSEG